MKINSSSPVFQSAAYIALALSLLLLNAVVSIPLPILSFAPILLVLAGMLFFKQGGHIAGPVGFITTLIIALTRFGFTPTLLFYSQWKGLNLTIFVFSILYPALVLYQVVNKAGGIARIADAMKTLIPDTHLLWMVVAVAFSAIMEGVAGFGLPIAVAAPILIGLGMDPIIAVASSAIGHSWSVTYGDMGAIFLTFHQLVQTPADAFTPYMAVFFGLALFLTAWAVIHLQGNRVKFRVLLIMSAGMILTQTLLVLNGLAAISDLVTGLVGIAIGALISQRGATKIIMPKMDRPLKSALFSYGLLALILFLLTSVPPIAKLALSVQWRVDFPAMTTLLGFSSKPMSQIYYPLQSTGLVTMLVALLSYGYNKNRRLVTDGSLGGIFRETAALSWQAVVGIAFMVGLSNLMEISGMSMGMAKVVSEGLGAWTPLFSPMIGTLGAFASGSNTSSNVLFAGMQENMALLLGLAPAVLIAAQTTGGSLGSMIAPAKIIVGCTTADLRGREGEVIKRTLPYALAIGVLIGLSTVGLILLG